MRGALLGAGNIAQNGHLPAYAALSDGGRRCSIVAASDLCDENLARASALVPGLRTYAHADELLEDVQPDFVDICAPPYVHRRLADLAIRHGCHVLCEKPLSVSLDDAKALARSFQGQPLVFVPGHQYHYAPSWRAITEVVRSGELGTLRAGAVTVERQAVNAGNSYWNPLWRTTAALSGGGILMDHGIHLFYQLSSLFGTPVRLSAGVEVRRHLGYEVEDTAWCEIEFRKGSVRVDLTWAAQHRRTVHSYDGTAGSIRCDEGSLEVRGARGPRTLTLDSGFSNDSSHAAWYVTLLDNFLDRIERANYDRSPLTEALLSMRCASAAYESARSGRPVAVE